MMALVARTLAADSVLTRMVYAIAREERRRLPLSVMFPMLTRVLVTLYCVASADLKADLNEAVAATAAVTPLKVALPLTA